MAIMILTLASGLFAALAAWITLQRLQHEYERYRRSFQYEAEHGLADFFLFLDPNQVWGATVAFACAVLGTLMVIGVPLAVAIPSSVAMLALPRFALAAARRRRLNRLDAQLPDFLLALAGVLRSGSGLQVALRQVARHSVRPLAQELGLFLQQQRMGLSFVEALDALQGRASTESVGLVVAAIKVSGHTGGSLAETLERISATLRTRLQLLGRIRALTAQGRMQAWVMAALPAVLAAALYAIDPESMAMLWRTAEGWAVVALILILEGAGFFMVRRIVNIEV